MTKKDTCWNRVREYINMHEIGEIITRQGLISYVYRGKARPSVQLTSDIYRRALDICGVLEIVGTGKYKINHHIKKNVSSSLVFKIAYKEQAWMSWFAIDRIIKLRETNVKKENGKNEGQI